MATNTIKIVKSVVGYIIFTLRAQNVCLQHECKNVDAGATSPTACSMNSVIQTVPLVLDVSSQFVDI